MAMITKADKRAAAFAASLVAIGVIGAVGLTLCAAAPEPAWSMLMGYSTGPELFNGMCKNMTSLLDCTNCCMVNGQGMPIEEREKCIDLCIDKFGASSAYTEIIAAARTVRDVCTADYVHYSKCRNLLRHARTSVRYPRVKSLAESLCAELNISVAETAHL